MGRRSDDAESTRPSLARVRTEQHHSEHRKADDIKGDEQRVPSGKPDSRFFAALAG